ncbi:uncharacterized protein DUF1064 [Trichococcus patagoniensis]|uniref:Uncharacterized protein DUF1064 n=1 Tax=Trichococcus patagoniensis TaxID=382641 RepID=A0A2T5ILR6_9LACT|nr:DUF1064 domain-containing protein [Trichococcus patagoniensis]PTQ84768.1 uncharacterized protein DUF1064 [Trichococcus patagoniensis]
MSKYGAKKITIDGITFDSKAEGRYYEHLQKLKKSGLVEDFQMQKPFTLLDRFAHPQTGRIVRAITYKADFEVLYTDGRIEVVDIKGFLTPEFKIKAKLFMFRYQIPLVLLKWSAASKKFVEV